MRPWRPVRGIVSPLSAGLFLMLSGVSPCAICQTISPLFRSIAVMRAVRRLDQRQPLNGQAAAAFAAAGAAGAAARRRPSPVRPPPAADPDAAGSPRARRARCPGCSSCPTDPAGGGTRPSGLDAALREDVDDVRLGIERAARPVGAAAPGSVSVASGPSTLLTTGGVKIGPIL